MFELKPEALAEYQKVRNTKSPNIICHAPFSNINFEQGGNATACCYNRKHVLGKFPEQTIKQMWFGEKAEELRNYIKAQDFNHGCELCANQINSFNFENSRLKGFDEYGEEETLKLKLKQKLGFKRATYPKCFEFEIDNICNLECVMCDGKFSSLIRQNRENLPPIISPYNDEFVNEVALYIPYLKEAKFLGGEPFLTPLYYKIWDKIAEFNPNLKVYITTNATVLTKKVKQVLQSLNARIILSIDSVKKETYEQIRQNANYEKVMDNIQYFLSYSAQNKRPISLAVCPITLNFLEIPEIVDFCNRNYARIYFNTVDRPYRLSLMSLDYSDLEKAKNLYKAYIEKPNTPFVFQNKQAFEHMLNYVSSLSDIAKNNSDIAKNNIELIDKIEKINQPILIDEKIISFFNAYLNIQRLVYFHSASDEFEILTKSYRDEIESLVNSNGINHSFSQFEKVIVQTFKFDDNNKKQPKEIIDSLAKLKEFINQSGQNKFEIFWRVLNVKIIQLIQGIEFTPIEDIDKLLTKEFTQ